MESQIKEPEPSQNAGEGGLIVRYKERHMNSLRTDKIRSFVTKAIIVLGILLMAFMVQGSRKSVHAASKKYVYYSSLSRQENYSTYWGRTSKISLKGKKLKITGTLTRAKSEQMISRAGRLLPKKKRTFKLAKSCKFYFRSEDGLSRVSKSNFMKYAKRYLGLGFVIFTNKSGKVTRLYLSS